MGCLHPEHPRADNGGAEITLLPHSSFYLSFVGRKKPKPPASPYFRLGSMEPPEKQHKDLVAVVLEGRKCPLKKKGVTGEWVPASSDFSAGCGVFQHSVLIPSLPRPNHGAPPEDLAEAHLLAAVFSRGSPAVLHRWVRLPRGFITAVFSKNVFSWLTWYLGKK